MKQAIFITLIGLFIFGTLSIAEAGPFTRREARHQERIYRGVQSGEITPREYQRLQKEQGTIEAYRQHIWADGTVRPGEACRLTRKQDRASRHIWQAKHNRFSVP